MGIFAYPGCQLGQSSIRPDRQSRQHRIHRYQQRRQGTEFFLETSSDSLVSYMTAQGSGVRPGDYIDIESPAGPMTFEVSEIEYYSHPADMWMAQLYLLTA